MRPFLLGLAGPPATGKTALADWVAASLGPERCLVVPVMAFRKPSRQPPSPHQQAGIFPPDTLDAAALRGALERLTAGKDAELPIYDPEHGTRHTERRPARPRPLILLEGALAILLAQDLLSASLYLDLPWEQCLDALVARLAPRLEIPRHQAQALLATPLRDWLTSHVLPQKNLATTALDASLPPPQKIHALRSLLPEILGGPLNTPPHSPENRTRLPTLPEPYASLARRMGQHNLQRRLDRQSTHWAGLTHQGEGILALERLLPLDEAIAFLLRATGLEAPGLSNARALRIELVPHTLPALHPHLEGFRILQLSDLHLDLDTGILPRLLDALSTLTYDLAVITGDFRNATKGHYHLAIQRTAQVIRALRPPLFAILGNHDFIEMVPPLEHHGLPFLLNEAILLPHRSATLFLAGIDDPHFYATHDWARVEPGQLPPGTPRILLAHSPEIWRDARSRFDLVLCGHTHGGQICLPGGIPLIRNGRCPAPMLAGAWRDGPLLGYTSRGTGCCGVPARFFCPPEITLHILHGPATPPTPNKPPPK